VWAVGVILFELLTGRLPYAGATTADVLRQLLRPTLQDPRRYCSDVPKSLAAICRRALAPALDDRYSSASEFAADLRRFLAGEPVLAERRSVWRAVRRRLWRQRHLLAGLVAVAAVGAMVHLKTAADGEQAERTKLLTELPAADTLGHAPWARVLAADATCRRLQALGGFSSAQQEQLAAVQSAIAAAAAARHERGRADIERGAGSRRGAPLTSYRAPVPAVQAAGVAAVSEAVLIRDDLTPSTALLATTQPVLQIAAPANMVDAPVRVDAIDPLRGDVLLTVATGVAPCSLPVPLGQYRIVVGDAAAFAECSRTLVAPGDHPVVPVLHATATVQSQMVTIAAGTAIVGQDVPGATIYQQCTVTHGAFCIDATEVTCGAYHAYCVATAAALPATWHGTYDPAWASLPVVGVSFHDARRFAEWRGKRLPTWIEWQIAARGPIGTLYPWGNDAGQLGDVVALGGDPTAPWHVGVRAVGSDSLDTSWCGALDLLANAPEWTDTTYVGQLDGVPIPFLAWHLTGGAGWTTPRDPVFVQLDGVSPNPPEAKEVGFRCAKSIAH
jgi:formylglycine-generating enzyme required for sulfatase activity